MLLSKERILHHIKEENIFIHPFDIEDIKYSVNLQSTSYDVRLGNYFYQQQRFTKKIFNPFNPNDIQKLWGEAKEATWAGEWMEENGKLMNVNHNDRIIILGPGETILAHTQEFIGGRNCVTTEMRAKSSMGRIGITVCKCAGWGDLGFCNRWTMEMTNHLADASVTLLVGMRVAQIIFYQVAPLLDSYAKTGGQYQATDDTEEMIKNWSPLAMLPKFKRDNY